MRAKYIVMAILILPSLAFASVRFGRDTLKGLNKTQGDFNLSHRFTVEIDGVMVAGVRSISGLEQEHDVVQYKDGEDGTQHTRPGNHKPGKITITKDWSNTKEWYNWRKSVIDGKTVRKSVSVIFHNDAGEEAGRMNFYQCFPTRWKGPNLNAKNSAHAIESIELACETVEVKGVIPKGNGHNAGSIPKPDLNTLNATQGPVSQQRTGDRHFFNGSSGTERFGGFSSSTSSANRTSTPLGQ